MFFSFFSIRGLLICMWEGYLYGHHTLTTTEGHEIELFFIEQLFTGCLLKYNQSH
jgi:hypothetical protein